MAQVERDRPCIHVCLVGGADEELYRWVEIGAEEEGVPVRRTAVQASEPVLAAFEAAQGSRFDVGVSVTPGRVILHERHMPAEQPVLSLAATGDPRPLCRLMGGNAARMVVRLPLRFAGDDATPEPAPKPQRRAPSSPYVAAQPATEQVADETIVDVATIARIVVRILRERGIV